MIEEISLFHDIGKLPLREAVMKKKRLSRSEWALILEHPELGALLTKGILHKKIRKGILSHHEEINGSGYPNGLAKTKIDLALRIVSVADDFCAMTESRGFNKRKTVQEALDDILAQSGTRYDARVTKSLAAALANR